MKHDHVGHGGKHHTMHVLYWSCTMKGMHKSKLAETSESRVVLHIVLQSAQNAHWHADERRKASEPVLPVSAAAQSLLSVQKHRLIA